MATHKAAPDPDVEPDIGEPVGRVTLVHHADLRHVPDGTTLWATHPDRPQDGTLVYTGGQALPGWVLENLAAGAALVPGPTGVLILGDVPKYGKGGKR